MASRSAPTTSPSSPGLDRDSALVADLFDERDASVKAMIQLAIRTAHRCGRKIGLCGQAPSDHPDFAAFLVEEGIDSISLNPDAVLSTRIAVAAIEAELSCRSGAPGPGQGSGSAGGPE